MEYEELDEWFGKQKGNWDTEHPATGHKARFVTKLNQKTNKKSVLTQQYWWKWLAVAATFTLLFGLIFTQNDTSAGRELADVSPKMQQTQDFFTASIASDLERLKEQSAPEDQKVVDDALRQLDKLETDYKKLKKDLVKSDENERVIHAMITNFQTRITLLNSVLEQLDITESLKNTDYENQTL